MIFHILWSKSEIIFTARKITWGYMNTVFFASVIQNTDLLIWYESTMINTKFPVSFSKNYSSNYVTYRTSQFSITWEYQKREFGKCDLSSSIDIIRSSLKQSITEHFLSIDSALNPKVQIGFCTLWSNQGVPIKPILCVCVCVCGRGYKECAWGWLHLKEGWEVFWWKTLSINGG